MQHILHRMHTCGVNMRYTSPFRVCSSLVISTLQSTLCRYLGLLRSKFLETARNYLVDGSSKESASASNSVGAVYSNIMFTEVSCPSPRLLVRELIDNPCVCT
jgi:hypothetical protein